MHIKSLLKEELTFAKIEGVSKKRVLDKISQTLANLYPEIDADTLFRHLVNREKLGSTGIGNGIAIPHCRFSTERGTLCCCLTLAKPIDFDAVDQEPVDVIFAMIVPEDAEGNHLETLAALAEKLQNPEFVSSLKKAKDSHELFKVATR